MKQSLQHFMLSFSLIVVLSSCLKNAGDDLEWSEEIPITINDSIVDAKLWALNNKSLDETAIYINFKTTSKEWFYFITFTLKNDKIIDGKMHFPYPIFEVEDPYNKDCRIQVSVNDNFFYETVGTSYLMNMDKVNFIKLNDTKKTNINFEFEVHFYKEYEIDHTGTRVPGAPTLDIKSMSNLKCPIRKSKQP